jgi:hypothetical protein
VVAGDGAGSLNLSTMPPVDAEMVPLQKEAVDSKTEVAAQTSTAPERKVGDSEEIINRIRSGWTVEDAHSISIGELYLMVCTLVIIFSQ